jgi:hypothetical protein
LEKGVFMTFAQSLLIAALIVAPPGDALEPAQRALYNAQYDTAASLTSGPCLQAGDLAACEVRTAALLFEIRRLLNASPGADKSVKRCAACPALMAQFAATFAHGKTLARHRLTAARDDDETLFLLSRLNLNHVWLHLGILGRKTGWTEYWEARRTLDKILKRNPSHVRARVARGWIDYIVDTKMPRGTRWLLGGGNKEHGLQAIRQAADADAGFFIRVEARFALWDMQVRERQVADALGTARSLARDFPDNRELITFIATHGEP